MLFQLHVIFQEILWRAKVTFTILTATQYIKKSSSYVKPPPQILYSIMRIIRPSWG